MPRKIVDIEKYIKARKSGIIQTYTTHDWGTEIKCSKDVSFIEFIAPTIADSGRKCTVLLCEDMNTAYNAKSLIDFDDAYVIKVWTDDEELSNKITNAIYDYYEETVCTWGIDYCPSKLAKYIKELAKSCSRCDIYTNEVEPMVFRLASSTERTLFEYDATKTKKFREMFGFSERLDDNTKNETHYYYKFNIFENDNAIA
jgi:hypothetical protein